MPCKLAESFLTTLTHMVGKKKNKIKKPVRAAVICDIASNDVWKRNKPRQMHFFLIMFMEIWVSRPLARISCWVVVRIQMAWLPGFNHIHNVWLV